MKIAIEALTIEKSAGNITYFSNILPYLERNLENKYFIFIPTHLKEVDLSKFERIKFIKVNFINNIFFRMIYLQLILPFKLKKLKIDLLYSPCDITSILSPCKIILAIRNPNPYFNTRNAVLLNIKYKIQKLLAWLSAIKAQKIIFVSNFSQKEVCKQLKIREHKTKVIYHGMNKNILKSIDIDEKKKRKIDILSPYILSISNLYPHKNYETLIEAYSSLCTELRNKYKLLIVGDFSFPQYFIKLKKLVKKKKLEERIIFFGRAPYLDIHYLYKKAVLFVLPSLLETFGHTLIETMAEGVPLIASNSTAIPEVVKDGGILFNPMDAEDLAYKMTLCLRNDKIKDELKKKAQDRVKVFSWQKTADQLIGTFKEIYNS